MRHPGSSFRWSSLSGSLVFALLAASCSSSAPAGANDSLGSSHDGGDAGDSGETPDGTGVPPSTCLETRASGDGAVTQYTRKTWDRALRILTAEYSSTRGFVNISTLRWRYASEGRIIAYIGVEQPFQHDYVYDEHDNVTDFRLSYPSTPNLMVPSDASPWIGTAYANEYDANGRLTTSTATPYGGGASSLGPEKSVYTEDASGHCTVIEVTSGTSSSKEVRTYDAEGRLLEARVSGSGASVKVTTYDSRGRIQQWTVTGTAPFGGGQASSSQSYTYLPDASVSIAIHDGFTDVLSEADQTVTRTAACLAIDAEIGSPSDARCRVGG